VSEAFSRAGEEFGTDRLLEVVRARRDSTATEIVDAIFDAVQVFRGDRAQSDDMTAVAVRITS
jgi:phosphoserine phosphatase RsbU/P